MPYEAQATPEEIKRYKRKCDCPDCKNIAWFLDWAGWRWCFTHIIRNLRLSEHFWSELKLLEVRWPF